MKAQLGSELQVEGLRKAKRTFVEVSVFCVTSFPPQLGSGLLI